MDDIKISLEVAGPKNEISVVRVDGVVDTMTATELEKVMNSLLAQKRFNVVIDLGGVDYISSAGWGIFISNIREIRQNKGDIKLARMIPTVYEIFELLEFDSILKAFDNVEKAKSDFLFAADKQGKSFGGPDFLPDTQQKASVALPEGPPSAAVTEAGSQQGEAISEKLPLPEAVLVLVKEDPFYSIREIKRELATARFGNLKSSWWQIFRILSTHKLLSKKSRFRYQRRR